MCHLHIQPDATSCSCFTRAIKKENGCLVWLFVLTAELGRTCLVYLVWVFALTSELGRTCLVYLVWAFALTSELGRTCLVYLVWAFALTSELGRTCLDYQVCSFMTHYPLALSTFRNIFQKPPFSCAVYFGRLTRATKLDVLTADNSHSMS
jgi:hypothetical protein